MNAIQMSRRQVLRYGVAGLGAAMAAPLLPRAGHAATEVVEGLQELYAAARKERVLNLYVGGYTETYAPWARAFEAAFPGVAVNGRATFSRFLAQDIDKQLAAGPPQIDLAILQTLQDFARWKRDGALLEFRPDGFDQIPAAFKDPDGTSVAVAIYGLGYGYNTDAVPDGAAPRSAPDFLSPVFRGRILATYPQDEEATLYLYSTIVDKYGWQFMDSLMGNQPAFTRGHLGVARGLGTGQAAVSFDTLLNLTLDLQAIGVPTDIAISRVDPLPIWPDTAAIFRGAPHPNAAKLFLAWYLGKGQQAETGTWSPRADVPPPPRLSLLSAYPVAAKFRDFVADEARLADLRQRFQRYVGPVEGPAIA